MTIDLSFEGVAAVVTINKPEKRNALTIPEMRELADAVSEAGRSDRTAIVLTGNGAFCSGADLKNVVGRQEMSDAERRADIERSAQSIPRALVDVPLPTFAAVDGPAIGLGFDVALACDSLLVGEDGWCMQGWGRIGAIPATGGVLSLGLRNYWAVWKLLAEQARVGGAELQRLGIAEHVTASSALDAALARAESLSTLPRAALTAYVDLARARLRRELPDHLAVCAAIQPRLLADRALAGRVDTALGKA
jgi:2-(1,2-epoxy-1,2-dihydrophenyl)acetyl-CoA isomerase